MPDIRHLVRISSSSQKVYDAITTEKGLASWWTPRVTARPEVGSIATFHFGPSYAKEMKIVKLVPGKEVTWKCTAATEEWVNTDLHFHIRPTKKEWSCFLNTTTGEILPKCSASAVLTGRCF